MECTVVSIYPLPINEEKPGMSPTRFSIPACVDKKPELLYVTSGVDHMFVGSVFGTIHVPIAADIIAKSIVDDFVGSIELNDEGAKPGLFWFPGKLTVEQVMKTPEYNLAKARQITWFMKLVKQGNDTWNKFRQHKAISDINRVAARELGVNAEWTIDVKDVKTENCPACMTVVSSEAVICANCNAVLNAEKLKSLQFAGAKN
jgi:hypothetical protein